jgi:hypothetical protein
MKISKIVTGDIRRILGTMSVMSELYSKHEFVKNKAYAVGILFGVCNAAVCRKGSSVYLRQSHTRVFLTALRPSTLDSDRQQVYWHVLSDCCVVLNLLIDWRVHCLV